MSRKIKFDDSIVDSYMKEIYEVLVNTRALGGEFKFSKKLDDTKEKTNVFFTPEAWAKMVMLVKEFDKEVAWHGATRRADDGSGYVVYDILVYPQTVTSTTVEMDEAQYANWIQKNMEDERMYDLHMQGHSHVNMGVTPSGVDLNHQDEILNMLRDDGYYIFMIWNKSFASNIRIFDMEKNTVYENGDVSVSIIGSEESLTDFIKNAKEMVKSKTYSGGAYSYKGQSSVASYKQANVIEPKSFGAPKVPVQTAPRDKQKMDVEDIYGEYNDVRDFYGIKL